MYYKYPRTPHLPWSRGLTIDDIRLPDVDKFVGKEVVVTEKMDGENFTLYPNYAHARSVSGRDHPSRTWMKRKHGEIKHLIPEGWRICGEYMFAEHSIAYSDLPDYYLVFGIYDENNNCLSWDEIVYWSESLGFKTVPVIYRGTWYKKSIIDLYTGKSSIPGNVSEGYVVRTASGFHYDQFEDHVAKFVRKNHIQTDEHWMHGAVKSNKLKV